MIDRRRRRDSRRAAGAAPGRRAAAAPWRARTAPARARRSDEQLDQHAARADRDDAGRIADRGPCRARSRRRSAACARRRRAGRAVCGEVAIGGRDAPPRRRGRDARRRRRILCRMPGMRGLQHDRIAEPRRQPRRPRPRSSTTSCGTTGTPYAASSARLAASSERPLPRRAARAAARAARRDDGAKRGRRIGRPRARNRDTPSAPRTATSAFAGAVEHRHAGLGSASARARRGATWV